MKTFLFWVMAGILFFFAGHMMTQCGHIAKYCPFVQQSCMCDGCQCQDQEVPTNDPIIIEITRDGYWDQILEDIESDEEMSDEMKQQFRNSIEKIKSNRMQFRN